MHIQDAIQQYNRLVAYFKDGVTPTNKQHRKYISNNQHDWRYNHEQDRLEARIAKKVQKHEVLPQFKHLHPSKLTKEHFRTYETSEFHWVWAPHPGL